MAVHIPPQLVGCFWPRRRSGQLVAMIVRQCCFERTLEYIVEQVAGMSASRGQGVLEVQVRTESLFCLSGSRIRGPAPPLLSWSKIAAGGLVLRNADSVL